MTAAVFPRRRSLWERLVALVSGDDPFARPVPGYQGQGFATQGQLGTVDGFKVGDVKYAFGTQASVLRDNPGWAIADGTATVTIDGVDYSPNLTGAFVIGADGSTFNPGDTGGSATVPAHTHAFTQPTAHADHAHTGHSAPTAHAITHETGHGTHPFNNTEVTATPGSGVWVGSQISAVALQAALSHANEAGGVHTGAGLSNNHAALDHNHDNATLNNNHSGGAVGAASGSSQYPPFVAVWPLIKVH